MRFLLFIVIVLGSLSVMAQGDVGYIYEELPGDSVAKWNSQLHTSIKPLIRQDEGEGDYAKLEALADLNYSYRTKHSFRTGLGANFTSGINNKWYFRIGAVAGISDSSTELPRFAYVNNKQGAVNLYTDIRSRISFTPNSIFNFQAGLDHHFIGEGSRSLFLSDYGTPYPFASINARFWRVEYAVLYQFMREFDGHRNQAKFASSHHISLNVAEWLNIGIFESVVFQPRDTLLERGFDVEYLNPLVFYRPQEYSLGSSDNVLLGMSLTSRIKKHTIYTQFIIDEFFLSELKAKSGWWANKFGGQLGYKASNKKNSMFWRLEYNFSRPYTFSHLSEELNYGNQGAALAHPLGANFMELLGEFKFQRERILCKAFASYFLTGNDKDGYSYGQNIYLPYTQRPYEYDHRIGQGEQHNGFHVFGSVAYRLTEFGKISAFAESHLRYVYQTNAAQHQFVVGVRSQLWNDYRNY